MSQADDTATALVHTLLTPVRLWELLSSLDICAVRYDVQVYDNISSNTGSQTRSTCCATTNASREGMQVSYVALCKALRHC